MPQLSPWPSVALGSPLLSFSHDWAGQPRLCGGDSQGLPWESWSRAGQVLWEHRRKAQGTFPGVPRTMAGQRL